MPWCRGTGGQKILQLCPGAHEEKAQRLVRSGGGAGDEGTVSLPLRGSESIRVLTSLFLPPQAADSPCPGWARSQPGLGWRPKGRQSPATLHMTSQRARRPPSLRLIPNRPRRRLGRQSAKWIIAGVALPPELIMVAPLTLLTPRPRTRAEAACGREATDSLPRRERLWLDSWATHHSGLHDTWTHLQSWGQTVQGRVAAAAPLVKISQKLGNSQELDEPYRFDVSTGSSLNF